MPFLTASWRYLAMLNYEIDPAVLAPLTPAGTEIDAWEGRTFASMVGFLFHDTRVLGVPVPLHRDFDEINLRFYVRARGPEGWRRGVVFVREIVPRAAIATLARWLYREPYVALPMQSLLQLPAGSVPGCVEYAWHFAGRWNRLGAWFSGEPALPAPGSQGEFITEHYWGYTAHTREHTAEYRVEHPQWRVWHATRAWLDCDVAAFYGPHFAAALSGAPVSAFVAEGSPVSVGFGR